jgi:hypothetical protein
LEISHAGDKTGLGFIAIVAALLAILLVNIVRKKPRKIPSDEKHRPLLDAVATGKS